VPVRQIANGSRTSACRYQITTPKHGMLRDMAQSRITHKGDRAQIMARPDRLVYEIVRRQAAERGIPMGQYVADVLAAHVGHPELVRELGKEALPLAM
jgi:hypothetical protein